VERDFGHVSSIGGALRANPAAFVRNNVDNVEQLPSQLVHVFTPLPFFPQAPHIVAYLLLVTLGAVGVSIRFRLADPSARRLRTLVVVWAGLAVTMVVTSLLIHPRHHYLQAVVALGLPLCAAGLGEGAGAVVHALRRVVPASQAAARTVHGSTGWLLAICVTMLAFMPSRAHGRAHPRRTDAVIAAMRALALRDDVAILETPFGFSFFADLPSRRAPEWTKGDRPFLEWTRELDVGLVVLDEGLPRLPSFGQDPGFVAFDRDPTAFGYDVIPVPGSEVRLAVRHDAAR
jgi:hypothetical protein